MIHTQYTCLRLPNVSRKEQLTDLLKVFAIQILEMTEIEEDSPFYCLLDSVFGQNHQEAIGSIVEQLLNYIQIEYITPNGAAIVVEADYEGDADNYDLCEAISKFLFPQSSKPYFLMRSAAADGAGAYSHQWVGYWKDGDVVLESTETYFDRVIGSTSDAHQLGIKTLPVGLA